MSFFDRRVQEKVIKGQVWAVWRAWNCENAQLLLVVPHNFRSIWFGMVHVYLESSTFHRWTFLRDMHTSKLMEKLDHIFFIDTYHIQRHPTI